MRVRVSLLSAVLFALALSAPAWAKDVSSRFQFDHTTVIAGAHLKAGKYRFLADESTGQIKVLHRGKVIAHVKGRWVDLQGKSQYNEVMSNHNDIQEIRFAGKNRAIKFSS